MKKTLRKILLWIASAFMFLSVIGLVATMPQVKKAFAAEEAWQTGTFEMDNGASLKLGEVGGLRFIVRMDEEVCEFVKTHDDAELGFVIAPKNLMLAANGDYLGMKTKIGGAIDKNKLYQDGNYWFANGCIANIKAANLTRSFTAIAYIKYNGEVRYTEYNDLARNNLYDAVNMAALTGKYTQELFSEYKGGYVQQGEDIGWYGSEAYPIVVENTAEYNALVDIVNKSALDFSEYYAVIKNEATAEKIFNDVDVAPTIKSEALDTVIKLLEALPDSVSMPDAIGQIPRIRDAEEAYSKLTETERTEVGVAAVAKLNSLLESIYGYDRVYKHDATDGTAVPATLHNSNPSITVNASIRYDKIEGNILTATPNAGGKAGFLFKNFPDVSAYETIYFKARVVDGNGLLFMADGAENDGWGKDWKNNSGSINSYAVGSNFKLFSVDVSSGYIGTDFAITLWGDGKKDLTLEITDMFGIRKEVANVATSLTFGVVTDSGAINEHGTVYNFTQGWTSENDLGSFAAGSLRNALKEGHDSLRFYIYNPNEINVDIYLIDTNKWQHWDTTTLKAKAWTEVTITSDTIAKNENYDMVCCVTEGKAATAGWQISKIFSIKMIEKEARKEASLEFGARTDTGTTNENGKIYNISREQWYVNNNNTNTLGTLQTNKLANALPEGYEYFYFWLYNPTDVVYNFHLAGDCNGTWTDTPNSTKGLSAKSWTKVTISAEDIELNKQGQWYVYITGGDGAGAAADGWKISTIYAGPDKQPEVIAYADHADVKDVIALINTIPETVTLADKAAVEEASTAYNQLTATQKNLVNNAAKLEAAQTAILEIEAANEVIELIDAIDPQDINETAVNEARAAYDVLSDKAKTYVTNLVKLQEYEAEISIKKEAEAVIEIINLIPEVVQMPQHVGYVPLIFSARDAYAALSEEVKELVTNYASLKRAITAINGYEIVVELNESTVKAVPGHSPNKPSTIEPTGTFYTDETYGQVFKATSGAGGRVSIQFIDFPSLAEYTNVYFLVRGIGVEGHLYVSEDLGNGGYGTNWVNNYNQIAAGTCTYSVVNNAWSMIELDLTTNANVFGSNWAMGVWSNATDETLEIAAIVGCKPNLGEETSLSFGGLKSTGEENAYGSINNLTQAWTDNYAFGAFNVGALSGYLNPGHDSYQFWVYNPNDSDASFYFNENETWQQSVLGTAKAKTWSKIVITPELIEKNNTYLQYVCVTSGAKTSGWQISPMYSFSSTETSQDNVDLVQSLIDTLNTSSIDEAKVTAARTAYEALSESEKQLVTITNLITCETALYGDCANQQFIVDGESNYKIYYESGLKSVASFTQGMLETATGATLKLVSASPDNITKYRYAIVFGYTSLAEGLGIECPSEEEIGLSGYFIKKVGRTVFILARGDDGYRMGALAFLREVIEYEMISQDCIIYNGATATVLPEFELTERPSFGYRQQQTYNEEVYGMGLQTHEDIWIASPEGWDMHNTLHYLPTEIYQSAHPSWYYTYTDSVNVYRTQICPTAGGSSAEFNAMVAAIAENMLVQINAYPDRENISFSIMDTGDGDDCQCARCTLYDTLYGEGGFAAAWIDLMNAVNAKIRESLPAGRVINIAFLAYRGTEKAPANDDFTLMKRYEIADNGSYTQTNEYLKCDEGVTVWLAPIDGLYAENFNHPDNAEHLATVKKWCALSSSVYLWMYGTNFKFYMYPYNSWQASAENYKIFHDLGVKAVWSQSNETKATAFSDLKNYIDAKFMFNVNADYEEVLDTYFDNYFGAASTTMRSLFDKIVAKCNEIEGAYNGLGRGIYDEIENVSGFIGFGTKTYWSKDWIDACVALCDQAKAEIEADTTLSEEEKTVIKNRITKESLFPRYVLCTTFANKYTTSNRNKLRQAFKADCEALGITLYCEVDGSLSALYDSWGV